MSETCHAEKRRYERVPLRTNVLVRIAGKPTGDSHPEEFHAAGKDMGVEGLCFTSEKELASGTPLNLSISTTHNSENIAIRGEVVWCAAFHEGDKNVFHTGVKFTDINRNHLSLLLNCVYERLGGVFRS